jgi:hypothetical protein
MNTETRNLWFWKAFVGALSLVHAQSLNYGDDLDSILNEICALMRSWGKFTGVSTWQEARLILTEVVWPTDSIRVDMCERLWEKINVR